MSNDFPVNFSFRAFESVSKTIDSIGSKFEALKSKLSPATNRFALLQNKTEGARKALSKVGDSFKSVGGTMSAYVTAPLTLLAGKMVHSAIEAQESASKFEQVFNGVSKAARDASVDSLKEGFDVSTQSANEFLATNGLLLNDLGIADQKALAMSEQMTKLAIQTAAFRNVQGGATATLEIFRAAMAGQTKGLKALGIVIDENAIKQEAARMAQQGARFETVAQAKAMATLSLINKKTADDQADFANSSKETENQLRVTRERFEELSAKLGALLLPAFNSLLQIGNSIMQWFINLSPTTQKVIVAFAAFAAAIGPILFGLGVFIGTILPAMITGFTFLVSFLPTVAGAIGFVTTALTTLATIGSTIFAVITSPFFLIPAVLAGVAALVYFYFDEIDAMIVKVADGIVSAWEPVGEFFSNTFKTIWGYLEPVIDGIKFLLNGAGNIGAKLLFGTNKAFAPPASNETFGPQPAASPSGIGQNAREIGKGIVQEMRQTNDARVEIDFKNMPTGTRVQSKASGPLPFLNLGQMGAPL